MFYMMNLPLSAAALQTAPGKPGDRSPEMGSPVNCNSEEMMASPRDPDVLKSSEHLQETENSSPPSASCETAWWVQMIWTHAGFNLHMWLICLHDNKYKMLLFFLKKKKYAISEFKDRECQIF